jgi:hypothetical protein
MSANIYQTIEQALTNRQGALIGRNGSIELAAMLIPTQINADILERHTGVWPASAISDWRRCYIEANAACDCIAAGWYKPLAQAELAMIQQLNPGLAGIIALRDLEPYYLASSHQRWTNLLSGKRVVVVSSFADTMKLQLERRHLIWLAESESLLPDDAQFSFIRTGYAPAVGGPPGSTTTGWPSHVRSCQDAIAHVVKQISDSDADIVLIGCGGLGMPIGAEVKKMGKIAVVMGGAIQVLFGIKGNRWENHPIISKFWNEHWVYPSADETPPQSQSIEGACYWR